MNLKEIVISDTLEEKEIKNLSEFATKSRFTQGREVFEEKCPLRTEFQRDRDRIIHSKSFRRLKHKAQVFFSPDDDHYRTRMTHTLEVSQCARTISRALNLNEDLTEAISLGHDLGHTPFGHSGESALNEIMPKGFKHNENSVRVVTLIENLNLTKETIDGIYSHSYDCPPAKTLEGQVVKFADKIAYIHHDMDDAIRAGIMKVENLPADCLKYFSNDRTKHLSKMIYNVVENSFEKNKISMDEECLFYMKKVRSWMFDNVYTNSLAKAEEDKAKKLIIELFNNYLDLMKVVSTDYDEIKAKQAACDCISGMTDRYIVKTYMQNFIPAEMTTKSNDDFIFRFAKLNGLINEHK